MRIFVLAHQLPYVIGKLFARGRRRSFLFSAKKTRTTDGRGRESAIVVAVLWGNVLLRQIKTAPTQTLSQSFARFKQIHTLRRSWARFWTIQKYVFFCSATKQWLSTMLFFFCYPDGLGWKRWCSMILLYFSAMLDYSLWNLLNLFEGKSMVFRLFSTHV